MNKKLFVSLQCLQTGILLNYFLVYFNGIIYRKGVAASTLGLNIRIGSETIRHTLSGENDRTIAHEVGHSGGLKDVNISNQDKVEVNTNLMTQVGYLKKHHVSNPTHVKGLHIRQINRILNNYKSMNKISAIGYDKKLSSSSIHPMFGFSMNTYTKIKKLKQ